jgi:hypothetical protein
MKFFEALIYPFRDEDWLSKLLLAMLVAAIPVVGYFAIKGWEFEVSVAVRHHDPTPLPRWDNFFQKLTRGILIRVVGFVYNLPTYVLLAINVAIWAELFLLMLNPDVRAAETWRQLVALRLVPRLLLLAINGLIAVAANLFYWAGYMRYIDTRRFAAFFEVGHNVRLLFNGILDDLVMTVYVAILSFVIGLLDTAVTTALAVTGVGALLAPILIPALTFSLLSVFKGHLFGQLVIRNLDMPRLPVYRGYTPHP